MEQEVLHKALASYKRQLFQLIKECASGEHRVRQMASTTHDVIHVIEYLESQIKLAPKVKKED